MVLRLEGRVDEEQTARAALKLEVNQLKAGGCAPRRKEKSSRENPEKESGRDEHNRSRSAQQGKGKDDKERRERQAAHEQAEAAKKREKLKQKEIRAKKEKEAKVQRARVLEEREERDQRTVFLNQTVVGDESSQLVMAVLINAELVQKDGSVQGHRGLGKAANAIIEKVDEPEIGWAKVVFVSQKIAQSVMQGFRDGKKQGAKPLGHIRLWSAAEWFEKRRRALQAKRKEGSGRRRDGREGRICFRFQDRGHCNFGTRCKFEHRCTSQ
jgi:hypothetical protein